MTQVKIFWSTPIRKFLVIRLSDMKTMGMFDTADEVRLFAKDNNLTTSNTN